jgi:hypothetical protein
VSVLGRSFTTILETSRDRSSVMLESPRPRTLDERKIRACFRRILMVVCMTDDRDHTPIIYASNPRSLDEMAMPRVTGELATVIQAGFTQLSNSKGRRSDGGPASDGLPSLIRSLATTSHNLARFASLLYADESYKIPTGPN